MPHFAEGDLVKVPIPNYCNSAPVKVLYASKVFKDAMGIGVCQWIKPNGTLRNIEVAPIKGTPIYTTVKANGWEVIGNRGLTELEENLTLRLVGDSVYNKDTFLREATESDLKTLHKMYGAGLTAAEEWIAKILNGQPINFKPHNYYEDDL